MAVPWVGWLDRLADKPVEQVVHDDPFTNHTSDRVRREELRYLEQRVVLHGERSAKIRRRPTDGTPLPSAGFTRAEPPGRVLETTRKNLGTVYLIRLTNFVVPVSLQSTALNF